MGYSYRYIPNQAGTTGLTEVQLQEANERHTRMISTPMYAVIGISYFGLSSQIWLTACFVLLLRLFTPIPHFFCSVTRIPQLYQNVVRE